MGLINLVRIAAQGLAQTAAKVGSSVGDDLARMVNVGKQVGSSIGGGIGQIGSNLKTYASDINLKGYVGSIGVGAGIQSVSLALDEQLREQYARDLDKAIQESGLLAKEGKMLEAGGRIVFSPVGSFVLQSAVTGALFSYGISNIVSPLLATRNTDLARKLSHTFSSGYYQGVGLKGVKENLQKTYSYISTPISSAVVSGGQLISAVSKNPKVVETTQKIVKIAEKTKPLESGAVTFAAAEYIGRKILNDPYSDSTLIGSFVKQIGDSWKNLREKYDVSGGIGYVMFTGLYLGGSKILGTRTVSKIGDVLAATPVLRGDYAGALYARAQERLVEEQTIGDRIIDATKAITSFGRELQAKFIEKEIKDAGFSIVQYKTEIVRKDTPNPTPVTFVMIGPFEKLDDNTIKPKDNFGVVVRRDYSPNIQYLVTKSAFGFAKDVEEYGAELIKLSNETNENTKTIQQVYSTRQIQNLKVLINQYKLLKNSELNAKKKNQEIEKILREINKQIDSINSNLRQKVQKGLITKQILSDMKLSLINKKDNIDNQISNIERKIEQQHVEQKKVIQPILNIELMYKSPSRVDDDYIDRVSNRESKFIYTTDKPDLKPEEKTRTPTTDPTSKYAFSSFPLPPIIPNPTTDSTTGGAGPKLAKFGGFSYLNLVNPYFSGIYVGFTRRFI